MPGNQKTKDDRLVIVYKGVEELIPYENNPRHNNGTVKKLKALIKKNGFKNPIVLDENDVIVCGHARLKAAQLLGIRRVPCVYAAGLTEDEIKAYRIADNKTAQIAGWDYDKLMGELQKLNEFSFDLDFTAFNQAEQYYFGGPQSKEDRPDGKKTKVTDEIHPVKIICETQEEVDFLRDLFEESDDLQEEYEAADIIARIEAA